MIGLPKRLAFVDVETTGTSFTHDRIIEVGIIRTENNKLVDKFQSLVNPECYLPSEITYLTGITSNQLNRAPSFSTIKPRLEEILEDCVFVAHNVRFDIGFFKSEYRRLEQTFSPKHFCTVKLSRFLYPRYKKHNLDALIRRYNIACENRHRAFDDANVLWEFYQKIFEAFPDEKLKEAINFVLKRPSRPIGISQAALDALPETPGVYIFYDENGMPLYIGKSVNIKTRVLTHFSNDYTSQTEMKIAQQVHDIESISTVGELGALIAESNLIKQMQPLYNRQLRHSHKMIIAKEACTTNGYSTIILDQANISNITPDTLYTILGIFKSKKQAKDTLARLAKEYNLCDKLLGLQKTMGACFAYNLKCCFGACVEEESPKKYNLRFKLAFDKTRVILWPFKGPIVIQENNPHTGTAQGFVVNQWCYCGCVVMREDGSCDYQDSKSKFDFDIYTIIRKYLKKPGNKKKIKVLNTLQELTNSFYLYSNTKTM